MDEQNIYKQFNEFLTDFLIRRAEGTLTDDDFDEKQLDYIRPHLESILPTLSLPEVMRIQLYFNEALSFHIKKDLGQQTQTSSQIPHASSSTSYNSEVQPFKRAKVIEVETQKESTQEETPHEVFRFNQRGTSGMMQSTPLSMPTAAENQMGIYIDQPEYTSALEDPFINDILAQVNLSPIPQEVGNQPILSNPSVNTFMQTDPSWIRNIQVQEHPFLQNFAHIIETAKKKTHNQLKGKNTPRQQLNIATDIVLPTHKSKRKRIAFEILCRSSPKKLNQAAEESFLYFPLLPRSMRNLIKRATGSGHTGKEQSNIPMEKIMNLSNVIRAYASEMQTSVDLPAQGSFLPSPCTPQNLLRTSQLQPFTPIRGDGSSLLMGAEMEQINLQTRSVIRQQPLLPIPERDSLLPRLTGSLDEVVPFRQSLSSVAQLPENILANQLDMDDDINLVSIAENVGEVNLEPQPSIHIGSPNVLPPFIEHHELSVQNENIVQNNIHPSLENHVDNAQSNWFDILRPRLDIVYPMAGREGRRRKTRKRNIERDPPSRPNLEIEDTPASVSLALPMIPEDLSEQFTQHPVSSNFTQLDHELRAYITLLKEGVRNPERTWEHFDPFLFSENDDFEMYTHIFKLVVREDFVSMDTLYMEGTSRLNAARGFRLLLELQTMGLIEILATGTRINGFKYRPPSF